MDGAALAGVLALMTGSLNVGTAWQALADADIREIRRIMEDNHPGPVDPENPTYRQRLEANFEPALKRAAGAKNFFDYKRAVRFYANGFRDGHIAAYFTADVAGYEWAQGFEWPGFAVRRDEAGAFRVAEVAGVAGMRNGDELLSCDGKSIDALLQERVDPYFWNADIPHERWSHLGRLFVRERGDTESPLQSCQIRTAGGPRSITIEWRPIGGDRAAELRARPAFGGEPSVRKVGDIWHVSIPTFHYQTTEGVARIKALIAEIKANAPAMRSQTLLFDVRGNGGGNSAWGEDVARALWGDSWIMRIGNSFDWTVDWRASPANVAMLDATVARFERAGDPERAAETRKLRDTVAAALKAGEPFARLPSPGTTPTGPPPANPVRGRVYLLTDGACASACLDFVDIVRRLPNVRHIGWATSADAVYIDNNNKRLPSSLAGFAYSMKVYRNRIRGNNVWYDPQIPWPGGAPTDDAVLKWVASLD